MAELLEASVDQHAGLKWLMASNSVGFHTHSQVLFHGPPLGTHGKDWGKRVGAGPETRVVQVCGS